MNQPTRRPQRQPVRHGGRLPSARSAAVQAFFVAGLLTALPCLLIGTPQLSAALWNHVPSPSEVIATAEQPVDDRLLFAVLALAGWITWAVLATSVLLEVFWALRHLSALRGSTGIALITARRTLGSLLIGGILITLLTTTRMPAMDASAQGSQVSLAPTAATAPLSPARDATSPDTVNVRPGDTLWHLAQSHLGDPLRWPEIYALNQHNTETDGRTFQDPNLIYPGWSLQLPAQHDAASHPTPRPSIPSEPGSSHTQDANATGAAAQPPGPSASAHAVGQRAAGVRLPRDAGYLSLALAAALGVTALQVMRRRPVHRPAGVPVPTLKEVQQRPEHHPLLADLRTLQGQGPLTPEGEAEPGLPIADQSGKLLTLDELLNTQPLHALTLTGPGAEDAVRALLLQVLVVPEQSGARVITTVDDLQRLAGLRAAPETLPGHVHAAQDIGIALGRVEEILLGRIRDHEVLPADEPLPPTYLITSQVPPAQHRRLLAMLEVGAEVGMSAVLLHCAIGEAVTVEVHHDGTARLHGGDPTGLRFFHLRVEDAHVVTRLLHDAREISEESGAGTPDKSDPEPESIISPPGRESEAIAVPDGQGVGVRESASAETSTNEDTPNSAGDDRRILSPSVPIVTAPESSRPSAQPKTACQVLEPPGPAGTPVAVRLFGTFSVTVHGEVHPGLSRGKIGEILAYLAVHDEGVLGENIWQDLWPERDSTSAKETFHRTSSNARNRLREALGAGPGAQLILSDGNGRWRLDARHFATDLADFHQALRGANTATDREQRRRAREEAVRLYKGELCAGGTFGWIDAHREHARIQAVAVHAELARTAEGIDQALSHLQQAITIAPTDEALYLEQAQLHMRTGNVAAVRRAKDLLAQALKAIDTNPTPATSRAFEDLLRSRPPAPSASARQRSSG
ncbi:BTAD domain-containing putative transcriptional regulator [Streptacidiphilus rugosus]|uniref:BTAD domain-containing putative transcriptional regulator n=1 Tax=Streptacidiphilus rugosus TaxID=405783 RepID=UPI000A02D449|nr:BTAD domain-containing putative transcriptional regulator [Streptacidiphilus rugosus]